MTQSTSPHTTPSHKSQTQFATLSFKRQIKAPLSTLWAAWTAPAARAVWAAPSPGVSVEFTEADTRVGGREISVCKVDGQPDIFCEVGWLALDKPNLSVNHEVVSSQGTTQSVALITAQLSGDGTRSEIAVTVQLSALASNMEAGYNQGFNAGLDNLSNVTQRTMILQRSINAPRERVWSAWADPQALPKWWGPEGFSCRTKRIDLRKGGEWVFDMIGPDGTIFPNHHLYTEVRPQDRIGYSLLWGENGPKHADAWLSLEDEDNATRITLGMVFSSEAEFEDARAMGAIELGQQTLAKLDRYATSQ